MIADVRAVLDAVAHAVERIGNDLRKGAGIGAVGPKLRSHARERGQHGELDAGPKPNSHRQARRRMVTNRAGR